MRQGSSKVGPENHHRPPTSRHSDAFTIDDTIEAADVSCSAGMAVCVLVRVCVYHKQLCTVLSLCNGQLSVQLCTVYMYLGTAVYCD